MLSFHKFLTEISHEDAERLRGLKRPFLQHLFGDKERIAFPVTPTKEMHDLRKSIESQKKPDGTPKYKISNDDLIRGIVRIVQKKRHPTKGEYLDTSNKQSLSSVANREEEWSELYRNAGEGPYWVILSRNAIDVKRMSDFGNLQSCHSFGGVYYRCTDEEVKDGGAVAYLVTAQDYNKICPSKNCENLQNGEIFADKGYIPKNNNQDPPTRNTEGINPIARVRVRRAINTKNNKEVALPELKVYGIDDGSILAEKFLSTVRSFVANKQPTPKDNGGILSVRGGTYEDSYPDYLAKALRSEKSSYGKFIKEIERLNSPKEVKEFLFKQLELDVYDVKKVNSKWYIIDDDYKITTLGSLFYNNWAYKYMGHADSLENIIDGYRLSSALIEKNLIDEKFKKYFILDKNRIAKLASQYFLNRINNNSSYKILQSHYRSGEDIGFSIGIELRTFLNNKMNDSYYSPDNDGELLMQGFTEEEFVYKVLKITEQMISGFVAKKPNNLQVLKPAEAKPKHSNQPAYDLTTHPMAADPNNPRRGERLPNGGIYVGTDMAGVNWVSYQDSNFDMMVQAFDQAIERQLGRKHV